MSRKRPPTAYSKPDGELPERTSGTVFVPPARELERDMLKITSPEIVIAALGRVLSAERRARIEEVVRGRMAGVSLVLENLHDPHNGSAALRSAESAGVMDVHVITASGPFRVSSRVTQGCDRWLEVTRHLTTAECLAALKRRGLRLLAAVPGGRLALSSLDPLQPSAFLIGNEHAGLSPEARAACDVEFGIPCHGFTRSLNLSVAAAIILYTHTARRRQALGVPGDLDEAARAELCARYYLRDVRGARQIIEHYLRRPLPGAGA